MKSISPLRQLVWFVALLFMTASAIAQPATRSPQPFFTDPALSPDGNEIAFVSGGDIWTVASTGAKRIC
jgi:hypothetical protein